MQYDRICFGIEAPDNINIDKMKESIKITLSGIAFKGIKLTVIEE